MNLNEQDKVTLQRVIDVYGHLLPLNRATTSDVFADIIRTTYDIVDNEKNKTAYHFLINRVRIGYFHKDAYGIRLSHHAFTLEERKAHMHAHYEKYLNYARNMGISFINGTEILDDVVKHLPLFRDTALNFIPLRQWDGFHGIYHLLASRKLSPYPQGGWSLADTVCTAKAECLRAALTVLTGNTVSTADDMINALETLNLFDRE